MSGSLPPSSDDGGPAPPGQRLYDNIFLLLVVGVLIITVVYTGWGLWEILTLSPAPLP